MRKMVIVIVDSGVQKDHKHLAGDTIQEIVFSPAAGAAENAALYGHGTAIYGIIRSCRDMADIINIRIPGIENGIGEHELIEALAYINENLDADIVNLSLGVTAVDDKEALKAACEQLTGKGVIIIAAFDNDGAIAYPAAFDNVIGVISGSSCSTITEFEYIDDTLLNIAARGALQRVLWSSPSFLVIGGSSFACAHVTVQAAKFFAEGIRSRAELLRKFEEIALRRHTVASSPGTVVPAPRLFPIKKAVLFPFNKEMHSLVRYTHLLDFAIVDVYDTRYSVAIGAATSQLMKDKTVKDFIVKNIEKIEWDDFDTLVLGHLDELENLARRNGLKEELLREAVRRQKNVYAFDDLSEFPEGKNAKVFYPAIDSGDLPPNRFGMLYRVSKPVIGVFGTSSQQGKFTLQLKMRELLTQKGYHVGQIGTEPSALLYGMDYVFPMGYNSSVYIKEHDTVRYLNHIMNDLCEKGKDIIIVGSQSGTVPYDFGNLVRYDISQYLFLLGTRPDAVILCANPFDDIEYIRRTISFIKSSADCEILALVMFPMDIKDDWSGGVYGRKSPLPEEKYQRLKSEWEQAFSIPVYKNGDPADAGTIIERIIEFF